MLFHPTALTLEFCNPLTFGQMCISCASWDFAGWNMALWNLLFSDDSSRTLSPHSTPSSCLVERNSPSSPPLFSGVLLIHINAQNAALLAGQAVLPEEFLCRQLPFRLAHLHDVVDVIPTSAVWWRWHTGMEGLCPTSGRANSKGGPYQGRSYPRSVPSSEDVATAG